MILTKEINNDTVPNDIIETKKKNYKRRYINNSSTVTVVILACKPFGDLICTG